MHALVAGGRERGEGKVPLPELRSRLAKTAAAGGLVDIDAHIKSYSSTPTKLRAKGQRAVSIRAARAQERGADIEDDEDDDAHYQSEQAGKLAHNLTTALSDIINMSEQQLKVMVQQLCRVARLRSRWGQCYEMRGRCYRQ